jgi:methyl-accepting chemotaxis protein
MRRWSDISLRSRLPLVGVPLTVIPLLGMTFLGLMQGSQMGTAAAKETAVLSAENLARVSRGTYQMCDTQQALGQRMVETSLRVAEDQLPGEGVVAFGQPVPWTVIDQFTKASRSIQLPVLKVGGLAIPVQRNAKAEVPYVDDVKTLLGNQCTLFQRMNDAGDMVRVATTVVGDNGERAIGTYIPSTMANGTPNGVLAKILKGESYIGRAFVVNAWYQAGYFPLRDAKGEIQGMLFVGVPTGGEARVRETMIADKIGQTGYAAVLDSTGKYVISPRGERDGSNVWDAKDADGGFWAQSIIKEAKAKPVGEAAELRYTLTDDSGKQITVVTLARYFEPWDWFILATVPEQELLAAQAHISGIAATGAWWSILIACVAVVLTLVVWHWAGKGLSRQLEVMVSELRTGSDQVAAAASQFSTSSQALSQGATEQAASLEETSASMEEMGSMARQNAENAARTKVVMTEVEQMMDTANGVMKGLVGSIDQISTSSEKVAKIVGTIDTIAMQTNILALNAAVEAARAGEAGMGFAVVAGEVRNLAQRSAEAAKDSAALIDESGSHARQGVTAVGQLEEVMGRVAKAVSNAKQSFDQVAVASEQQTTGLAQVTTALQQMEKVTQSTAATAEESAAASTELGAQVEGTNTVVTALSRIISGDTLVSARETGRSAQGPSSARRQVRRAA